MAATEMATESSTISQYSTTTNKGWSLRVKVTAADDGDRNERGSKAASGRTVSLLEQTKENAVRLLHRPWFKRQVIWNDQEWSRLENDSMAYDTHSLMVSCGTVTIDRAESADRQILLIWNNNTKAWQLPKGRKNVHEDFAAAALRETTEETGVAVQPLYLRFCTRLTLPEKSEEETAHRLRRRSGELGKIGGGGSSRTDNGIVDLLNKDIFSISQYPDPATGAMRHIYWYAARPLEAAATPNRDLLGQEDGPVMTAQWFSAAEAVRRLKMSVERKAVVLAVHYAEQMSEEEWKYSLEL